MRTERRWKEKMMASRLAGVHPSQFEPSARYIPPSGFCLRVGGGFRLPFGKLRPFLE